VVESLLDDVTTLYEMVEEDNLSGEYDDVIEELNAMKNNLSNALY
jgi:hypothetical protein